MKMSKTGPVKISKRSARRIVELLSDEATIGNFSISKQPLRLSIPESMVIENKDLFLDTFYSKALNKALQYFERGECTACYIDYEHDLEYTNFGHQTLNGISRLEIRHKINGKDVGALIFDYYTPEDVKPVIPEAFYATVRELLMYLDDYKILPITDGETAKTKLEELENGDPEYLDKIGHISFTGAFLSLIVGKDSRGILEDGETHILANFEKI